MYCSWMVEPNGFTSSFQTLYSWLQYRLPACRSVMLILPGSDNRYGLARRTSPPCNPFQWALSPLLHWMAMPPIPAAGDGFTTSICAVGNAHALHWILAVPANVLKVDRQSLTAKVFSEHVSGIKTRFSMASYLGVTCFHLKSGCVPVDTPMHFGGYGIDGASATRKMKRELLR